MEIDHVIDYFVDHYNQQLVLVLLKTLSFKEQGGLGYSLKLFNPVVDMDGWEVNPTTRTIYLDHPIRYFGALIEFENTITSLPRLTLLA